MRRNTDPMFDDDAIENQDPLGERTFEESGFDDSPSGGPQFDGGGLEDKGALKTPGRGGQKVAGIPEAEQKETNTASGQRPDSEGVVIRERGGASKGDPAVGATPPQRGRALPSSRSLRAGGRRTRLGV
jgi:hypothetical protein